MQKDKIGLLIKSAGFEYEKEYKFLQDRKFRFDYALPAHKVGIEYEGISGKSRHTSITGYTNDCEKYNLAQIAGWKVLRYTVLSSEGALINDITRIVNGE